MAVRISQSMAQKIVDTVKDICGFDINFINKDAIVFASTDPNRIGDYHGIASEVIRTGYEKEIDSDMDYMGTKKGVNMPVFFHEELCGVIGISGEPEAVRKYAYLAQRIARMLLREQEIESSNYSRQLEKNYFIHSLLSEQKPDPEHMMEYLKKNHVDGTEKFRAVLIRLKPNAGFPHGSTAETQISETILHQTLDSFQGGLYTFEYPDSYIFLCPEEEYRTKNRLLAQLLEKYPGVIEIGTGMPRYLSNAKSSYEEAEIALYSGRKRSTGAGGPQICCYENLDLEILLGSIPIKIKDKYLEKVTGKLSEEDREILKIYFENDCSLAQTAAALFIHKNTLQYRLNRIAEQSGYNPRNYRDSVVLYLALMGEEQ